MQHETAYIDQRQQKHWPAYLEDGILSRGIPPWAQCFYASVVMFLTFYLRNVDVQALYDEYFDDIETSVGSEGIGEDFMRRHNLAMVHEMDGERVRERSGRWWSIQCSGASHYLQRFGSIFAARWAEIPWAEVRRRLEDGPVVLGTKIPPSSGHIILLVGMTPDRRFYIAKDPYGDGRSGYRTRASGDGLLYGAEWLESHASYGAGIARAMWAEPAESVPG